MWIKLYKYISILTICFVAFSCNNGETVQQEEQQSHEDSEIVQVFTLVTPEESGLNFTNNIFEDLRHNFFDFEYIYNGGGVGIGDINNDGLDDVFFTGSMVPNKLFLNQGDLKFEDISESAGIADEDGWCTGVTMVDINADGWLDIYVCRSYAILDPSKRKNLLFINNGDNTFTEQAASYGLDDGSFSTQATFFDYDLDNDLDMFLGNHPEDFTTKTRIDNRVAPKYADSDNLYRNNGDGTFTDVTKSAGIQNFGFTLGVIQSDINMDGWPDIYVANDYIEEDFIYINNQDGTFSMQTKTAFAHISNFGMGVDVADYNNDGLPDVVVVDMVAEDNYRQKTNMGAMAPEQFWFFIEQGFHYQYMRNSLQLNNGNGTFSEIGQLAGISNTDWSWAPLMMDFDNDGYKDLVITNGYRRDAKNKDAQKRLNENIELIQQAVALGQEPPMNLQELLDIMPSVRLNNYVYQNNGDLSFTKRINEWGFDIPSFSNGAAYGDLDNDGDIELVINNLVDPAFLFKNNTRELTGNNYIQFKFHGNEPNTNGIGVKVTIHYGENQQYMELTNTRGYLSSMSNVIHFGLGEFDMINRVEVFWPDNKYQRWNDIKVNQVIEVYQKDGSAKPETEKEDETNFVEVSRYSEVLFKHIENEYDDYEKESLLPHKMSQFGPNIATGDLNGDEFRFEDFYIGGAAGQSGAVYINNDNIGFVRSSNQPFNNDRLCEDIGVLMFDSDGDGDLDLYVVSGGNEFDIGSELLQDRLYINDGFGNFEKSETALPEMLTSGSCVTAGDYDNDGDLDLFVGGRVVPGKYGFSPFSYILENNNGKFTNVTEIVAPALVKPGMVTSAIWTDYDNDDDQDLIVVGEWMPISIYENVEGKLIDRTFDMGMENTTGWWNKVVASDLDGDGDMDYVLGNLGLNYKYKASVEEPLHFYCHDFDENGTLDIVLGYYNQGICYPVRGRQCSSEQMPIIKEQFKNYDAFGAATLEDVYGSKLDEALQHHQALLFESVIMKNNGDGSFEIQPLPIEAQFSTVFGIIAADFTQNGQKDILLAGNFYVSEVETGRADAGIGLFLEGDGKGNFKSVSVNKSGFFANRDVRDLAYLNEGVSTGFILVGNNNDYMQVFHINNLGPMLDRSELAQRQ